MKPISVVILNWNGLNLLKEFLPRVLDASDLEISEIIVADNGSTDGSCDYVRWMGLPLIRFDKNHGFAEGYNLAIKQIESKYTILLNSDVAPRKGWDTALLQFMETHPECGACQPKILSWHYPEKFEYAGACGGFIDRYGYPYCRGRIFGTVETDSGQYQTPMEIDWATGAALMVRTELYKEVGGLDASFFAHMEEIDLCCRMHNLGYRVCVVPESSVYHLGGASLAQGNPKKTYLNFRNNLLLLHKNLPEKKGKRLLIKRRLMDTLAFFMYAAKLDFKNAGAILRAHSDFRRMKKEYTAFPERDILSALPGADRCIVADRYLPWSKSKS